MADLRQVVIVGGGLAGASAARSLRQAGFGGAVVLVAAEPHLPYERPPLSKEYLRGERGRSAAAVESAGYWAEHNVELRTGVDVRRIDLAAGRVELTRGEPLSFDRLLLAPGAAPRALRVPGSDLDGVVTLRTFEDAEAIRSRAAEATQVLVVGGGWIGSEVSASLRQLGRPVTWAIRDELPFSRTLGPQLGQVYRDLHVERGVTVLGHTEIVGFDGAGRVRRARTAADTWLDADLVVVAVGVDPRTELARDAGLVVGDGIVVDERLATSDPRVFAAGDVALVPHQVPDRSLRVEHWGAAVAQGEHAGRAMIATADGYTGLPYYFSDQYDTGMEFWGDPGLSGELVVRGELDSRSFTAFWQAAGRVTAVLNMHVHHHGHGDGHAGGHIDSMLVDRLLRAASPVDEAALSDPDIPLETLVAGGATVRHSD